MGMSEREFLCTTPRFFVAARKGFARREQGAWERARYIAFYAVAPHAKKGSFRKLTDLTKFPWEERTVYQSEQAREQAEKLLKEKAAELFGGEWNLKVNEEKPAKWQA